MSDIKLKAASGGGSISLKGPSSAGSDTDFLDTSGNLKVTGNTTVDGKILIGTTTALGSNADDLNIKTTGNTGISIQSGTSSAGNIYFADGTSGTDLYRGFISYNHSGDALSLGTANTTNLSIDSWGNVEVDTGNLVIGTAGKGIDFSATSDASGKTSELLDDYEEGTWTPTIHFGSGNTGITYGSNTGGWYTKIGRMVTLHGRIALTSKGSSSGALKFSNFPFTVASANSGNSGIEGCISFSYLDNIDSDDGGGIYGGYAAETTTYGYPFYVDSNSNNHYVEEHDCENDTELGFLVTYCV